MAYTKTVWGNDTLPAINETNLNNIENGIEDVETRVTDIEENYVFFDTEETWSE